MSHKNPRGLYFLRPSKGLFVLFLSAILLMLISPSSTMAGCVQDTSQWNKDVSEGKLNEGAKQWVKKKGNSDFINDLADEPTYQKLANNYFNYDYINSGEAGSPVINDCLGTGVNVIVGTYGSLGGAAPSLGEVIELSWWQKAVLGIKDIYGAAKNIFRVFGPAKIDKSADLPAQIGKPLKKDNCDFSHYQIKYNEPKPTIEAIREKITSLNIGRYSAVNSDGRTIIEIRGSEKDGPLTKTELDKLNKGLAELGIFEPRIFSSLETINGVCGKPNEPLIINKEDMEKLWPQLNTQTIQPPQAQQGKIAALVISPDGQPVYQAKFWLVDSQGRLVDKSAGGIAYDSIRYTTKTGGLETLTVPNGQYTLNITCSLHCFFGEQSALKDDLYAKWSKTLQVEVKGSDIWLDKVTIIREK